MLPWRERRLRIKLARGVLHSSGCSESARNMLSAPLIEGTSLPGLVE